MTGRGRARKRALLTCERPAARPVALCLCAGDPVFSNAILTRDGQVKLIDMRGSLGDRVTTQGDRNYDLSKVYQSLCGYDFMLLDKRIAEGTAHALAQLRDVFWQHVRCAPPPLAPAVRSGVWSGPHAWRATSGAELSRALRERQALRLMQACVLLSAALALAGSTTRRRRSATSAC